MVSVENYIHCRHEDAESKKGGGSINYLYLKDNMAWQVFCEIIWWLAFFLHIYLLKYSGYASNMLKMLLDKECFAMI